LPSVPEPPTILMVLGGGLILVSIVVGKKLI
jgi:hypothetical protein